MRRIKFFKVYRAPLELPDGPMIHFGIAVVDQNTGETWVLHNTPAKNEHVGSIDEFAADRPFRWEELADTTELRQRFVAACSNPKLYDLLANNCQHTANRVAEGVSWSPGLWVAGILIVGVFAFATTRGRQCQAV